MGTAKYNDRSYRARASALKRRTKANGDPCSICGQAFDWSVDWKHPLSFTADHVEPIAHGGHLLGELAPAHRGCNSRRGAGREVKVIDPPKTSRRW